MFEYLQEVIVENDQMYMENCFNILNYSLNNTLYDDNDIMESVKDAFNGILDAIDAFFSKIIESIKSLFTKNEVDTIKKVVNENPEIAKTKIKIHDQKELDKLYNQCVIKIEKGEDPNKVISYYKKRSSAIKTSVYIIGCIGVILYKRDRDQKKQIDNLQRSNNRLTKKVEIYKKVIGKYRVVNKQKTSIINKLAAKNKSYKNTLASTAKSQEKINELSNENQNLKKTAEIYKNKLSESNKKCNILMRKYCTIINAIKSLSTEYSEDSKIYNKNIISAIKKEINHHTQKINK